MLMPNKALQNALKTINRRNHMFNKYLLISTLVCGLMSVSMGEDSCKQQFQQQWQQDGQPTKQQFQQQWQQDGQPTEQQVKEKAPEIILRARAFEGMAYPDTGEDSCEQQFQQKVQAAEPQVQESRIKASMVLGYIF